MYYTIAKIENAIPSNVTDTEGRPLRFASKEEAKTAFEQLRASMPDAELTVQENIDSAEKEQP